jgi:translation initiation factor 1 (eIF-1/SUI1)
VYTPEDADEEAYLPLTRFRVTYAMNEIPMAEVYPAIGFNLRNPEQITSITGLQENSQVRIDFRTGNTTVTLLEGFVSAIVVKETATAFKRSATAAVTIKHNAIRLAGAAPSTFRYQRNNFTPLQTLYSVDKTLLFVPDPANSPTGIEPSAAYVRTMSDNFGEAVALYPSVLLKQTCELLAREWDIKRDMANPDDLIRGYDPANLAQLNVASVPLLQSVASVFSQAFPNGNMWEALKRTAKYFHLNIIPFNRGIYIANDNGLIRDPDVFISAGEYHDIQDTEPVNTGEPVDGIAVLNPYLRSAGVDSVLAVFPVIGDPNRPDDAIPTKGKYYHFREFPSWLVLARNAVYGDTTDTAVNEQNPGAATPDRRPTVGPEDALTIAQRLAKQLYAEARSSKKLLAVNLPYRTDLMPGTMVAIQKPEQRADFFVSEDIYGHIRKTVFEASLLTGKGTLGTTIVVDSARTASDNASDELTFASHPIYQGKWTGVDLQGNFLQDLPQHTPLESPPTRTNDARTGERFAPVTGD